MTTIKITNARPSAGFTYAKAARAVARFGVGMWQAFANRRRAAALNHLDDRLLADIGLTRDDIRDAFASAVLDPAAELSARRRRREAIGSDWPGRIG